MGEEPGHLPGSRDPREMLDTDLEEARLLYLQAVYRSAEPDARPFALMRAIDRFGYSVGADLDLRREAVTLSGGTSSCARISLKGWCGQASGSATCRCG